MPVQSEEQKSLSPAWADRSLLWHGLGTMISIWIGIAIQRIWHATAIGLGVMAFLMTLSAVVTIVPKERRNLVRLVVAPILFGLVMWAIVHASGLQTFD